MKGKKRYERKKTRTMTMKTRKIWMIQESLASFMTANIIHQPS